MSAVQQPQTFSPQELGFSPTAWLFEGRHAGVGFSMFTVPTGPGKFVELHVHPYSETFVLLEGQGRWTAGETVVELEQHGMIVVPPDTPHGFRNVGDTDLLVVSVHESATLQQEWTGREPA